MKLEEMRTITNGCSCVTYNEETGDWETAPECWGDCWDCSLEDFHDTLSEFVDNNPTTEFSITGFPVWYGRVDGYFEATTTRQLLDRITPNRTEWTLRYALNGDTLECFLSHHDGSGAMTITYRKENND